MSIKTIKETIVYTISMFGTNPNDFCVGNEVKDQFYALKKLALDHDIDFESTIKLSKSGKKLYDDFKNLEEKTLEAVAVKELIDGMFSSNDDKDFDKDLVNKLDEQIKTHNVYLKILSDCDGDSEKASKKIQAKEYTDGLIDNLINANLFQLKRMLKSPGLLSTNIFGSYYSDEYVVTKINDTIRLKKYKKILENGK